MKKQTRAYKNCLRLIKWSHTHKGYDSTYELIMSLKTADCETIQKFIVYLDNLEKEVQYEFINRKY